MSTAKFSATPWLLRTLAWGAVLAGAWYMASSTYLALLGRIVAPFWPRGTFLAAQEDVFSIGLLLPQGGGTTPLLSLNVNNLGFGLVVVGAVALGTQQHSWALRILGVITSWALLTVVHAGVLVAMALAYRSAAQGDEVPLGSRLVIESLHPFVIILPLLLAVAWLLLPAMRPTAEARRRARGRRARGRAGGPRGRSRAR